MKTPDFLPTDPKKIPKPTRSITDDLPDYLKDHANYEKIQRQLLDALATPHSHTNMFEWYTCKNRKCREGISRHRALLKKLGFKNAAQYMQWKKIHEYIKNPPKKQSLAKYNEPGLPTASWTGELL